MGRFRRRYRRKPGTRQCQDQRLKHLEGRVGPRSRGHVSRKHHGNVMSRATFAMLYRSDSKFPGHRPGSVWERVDRGGLITTAGHCPSRAVPR
jgi:hypothetical protein